MPYKAIWAKNKSLNEVEHIKLERDGLDVIKTIVEKYSKEGYHSITPEAVNRFKWAGIYEQKPKAFLPRLEVGANFFVYNNRVRGVQYEDSNYRA